jgi:hypothetical protein
MAVETLKPLTVKPVLLFIHRRSPLGDRTASVLPIASCP